MDNIGCSAICQIRQCSQCHGSTEYFCNTCNISLCLQCKEMHAINLDTLDDDVVVFSQNRHRVFKQETCVRHPDGIIDRLCRVCKLSICPQCEGHNDHKTQDLGTLCISELQQNRDLIQYIKSDVLYYKLFLLAGIKSDVNVCRRNISNVHEKMVKKSQTLKRFIDSAIAEEKLRLKRFARRRLKQQKQSLASLIVNIQVFEHTLEQTANRPIEFLSFLKRTQIPMTEDTPNLTETLELSLREEFKRNMVVRLLREIESIARGKRHVVNRCLKTFPPMLQKYVTPPKVDAVLHISTWKSGLVWVSDRNNIILTNTTGVKIHHFTNRSDILGHSLHTVTRAGNLIYIDSDRNIVKLMADRKTHVMLRKITHVKLKKKIDWKPLCVYSSPSTGDLLIGMSNLEIKTNSIGKKIKITRNDRTGKHVLTMRGDTSDQKLSDSPLQITENRNKDVIVSGTFVTALDVHGVYRFSYKGPRKAPPINSCGICTDAFSNILVCDNNTKTVQMIDKDGQYLGLLLNYQRKMFSPASLSYDDKTHLLWIGFRNCSRMSLYRYIDRMDYLTGEPESNDSIPDTTDEDEPQVPGLQGATGEMLIRMMHPSISKLLGYFGKDINDLPNSGNSDVKSRPRSSSISNPERQERHITLCRWDVDFRRRSV